ncbi:MAG: hypothetical protein ACI9MJ_000169 [Alphaproteobacteria bacterium]|jgi:hypothetical protein
MTKNNVLEFAGQGTVVQGDQRLADKEFEVRDVKIHAACPTNMNSTTTLCLHCDSYPDAGPIKNTIFASAPDGALSRPPVFSASHEPGHG